MKTKGEDATERLKVVWYGWYVWHEHDRRLEKQRGQDNKGLYVHTLGPDTEEILQDQVLGGLTSRY